ncbi:ABC transporter substrate-binding protein [Oceanospirillum sediminis]|uniref:ABC transporter substrate-binding protein n=1 Tax=Oceanospirillum sediminis TaxID=2760088 RepID=A0A839IPG8_9GAMM|nr:ABC transporter substrate-binding protein [Oceanospirillum sediminis]MBB1486821.1 ABC transporter substrate-binding protein [Oceanospirillum sediminis]
MSALASLTKPTLFAASVSLAITGSALFSGNADAAKKKTGLDVQIHYLRMMPKVRPVLSNLEPAPKNSGLAGAELGIKDSNTTGRFTGQHYMLNSQYFESEEAFMAEADRLMQKNALVLIDAPSGLLAQTDKLAAERGALIFNTGNSDDQLRTSLCLNNTFHTYPSRAMHTDALAQWLATRRFSRWMLIEGPAEEDKAYASALKRSAKRFGSEIVLKKEWTFDSDLRRTAQKELPLFTQGDEYDVVLVADEAGDFGHYVPYNTWLPRPVAGTQGLTPKAWHKVVEQWGAAQLQSRFEKLHDRHMNDKDYAAWAAIRSISEAILQNKEQKGIQHHAEPMKHFLLSEKFHLAAFKGHKLTYRQWNGQLRQPMPLVQPRSLVSQSPQAGYLHPKTELDTLGFDQQESQCRINQS